MSKIISIGILIVLGVLFFGATLRGTVGNFTDIKDLKQIEKQTGSPFESSHERASYSEMLQMRKSDTPALSNDLKEFSAPDVGSYRGKSYSYFPPGISILIRPFFELGYRYNLGLVAAYSSMALISIGTMILIYLICKNVFDLPSHIGILAALIYAFATTSWSYSVTIFQHAPTAFFAAVMFYGVARYRARVKTSALWASAVWFTYGISILFDYPNGLLLAPFIIYYLSSAFQFMRQEHKLNMRVNAAHLGVTIWFFIAVAVQLTFNLIYMPNWYTIRQFYARYDPALAKLIIEQDKENKVLTVTSENIDKAVEQRVKMPFVEEVFFSGIDTLLVAPDKGIFYFSPILLFAIWGLYYGMKNRPSPEHAALLAFILLNVFVYASFGDPYGGWAFGPRYLIPSMVALSIYTAYAFYSLKHPVVKTGFYALFLVSMSIAAAGVLTTNNVPPQVEAIYLKRPYYNFALNFHLIETHKTSSFIYNTYLKNYMAVDVYYVLIVLSLGLFVFGLLFISPLLFKRKK